MEPALSLVERVDTDLTRVGWSPPFDTLPNELVCEIFTYVEPYECVKEICRAVCRLWRGMLPRHAGRADRVMRDLGRLGDIALYKWYLSSSHGLPVRTLCRTIDGAIADARIRMLAWLSIVCSCCSDVGT